MKERRIEEANRFETDSIGKLIAQFAIPGVTAMLVNSLYNIVDQIFIGRGVGYLGNGAANVVLLITLVTLAFSLLFGDGAAAYFSLSLGEGKTERAARAFGSFFVGICTVSLMVTMICFLFLKPILMLLGCTEVILPYAMEYGRLIVLGLPLIMISTALNSMIRADGSPRYAMASMIAGALINGCLDPIFIFGLDWGIKGAAAATLVGQLLSFVISIAYLKRFRWIEVKWELFRFRVEELKKICGLGISSFIDQTAFTLVMAVNNNLIVHYGALSSYGSEIPLTAYGISMKVQEILFTLLLGVAIGMQPIVGYNQGAGNGRRVRKAYFMAVGIATILSIGATMLFVFFPDPIIHLFGSADQTLYLEFSRKFFQTYFLLYVFFGFQMITGVFFQAVGKPMQAAVISLSYQLVFKILSALLLSSAMGLSGVLWSGPLADFLAFFLTMALVIPQLRKYRMTNSLKSRAATDK